MSTMIKPARKAPWLDYGGRLSPLKLAIFLALFVPGLWIAWALTHDQLGARPLEETIHQIGLWAIRLLFLSLLVTPLRRMLDWGELVQARRMIGVAAFAYAFAHLCTYTVDQAFDLVKVATEIALRFYLTIGFAALLGLGALAATSTDGMVRRLGGKRWRRLHQLVYLIAILAVVHFFIQSKLEVKEPMWMGGLLLWMLLYRAVMKLTDERRRLSLGWLLALDIGATAATALVEALYYGLKLHAPPLRILSANFMLATGTRPAWIVLGVTVVLTVAGAIAASRGRRPRLRPA